VLHYSNFRNLSWRDNRAPGQGHNEFAAVFLEPHERQAMIF
jgi:hypothetical protein